MKKSFWSALILLLLLGSCRDDPLEKLLPETSEEGDIVYPYFSRYTGDEPYDYVNPFIGTGLYGHTYPGATVPFGMVQLSPDTDNEENGISNPWCAGYQYGDNSIMGFSHTHFSGTGLSDLGDILIMPTMGELFLEPGPKDDPTQGYRSSFSHEHEFASPGYYSVLLEDYGIQVELSATERVGIHKYTFRRGGNANIILDLVHSLFENGENVLRAKINVVNDSLVTGYRQTSAWAKNRYIYFAIEFSKAFASYGLVKYEKRKFPFFGAGESHERNSREISGRKIKAYFSYETSENEVILVKTGISGVDISGALKNLRAEIPGWDFKKVRKDARDKWREQLNKIVVEGDARKKNIFYTCLYHSMLAPVTYMDVDGRYRGADMQIHQAEDFVNYTIFSLWDTFRTAHPLFTITQTERTGDMIRSMLEHRRYHHKELLPVWSFHANETNTMIAYHSVSVIADAYLKGIRGFDTAEALEAMKYSSQYEDYDGLGLYMKLGYVPIDKESEAVSKTLEYAYDDWAIAMTAKAMGSKDEYEVYIKRAQNYRNVFDPETLFMRARNSDGTWKKPFDPQHMSYSGDYTEGNAWQYSWFVPHDIAGLIELMGGRDFFADRLDSLFDVLKGKSHNLLLDDISGFIGQYAHGNEPGQHIPYLYNYAGKPWKSQERVSRIMNDLYDNNPFGLCGNDDCGQLSAWFVFSSLGFYPVCPGSGEYVFGTPYFKKAVLRLPDGKKFIIEAKELSAKNVYIQSVTLNGNAYEDNFVRHEDIVNGGELIFHMGPKPNKKRGARPENAPYSMSR